ncbi:MAG: hypothetical protein LBI08_04085 [Methanomassiliicoccaceae archaeon]|jgi:uncharacterized membrane protein YbaN (DUF454 family)|nr:hypothetical protein [Methanomassiliicoccaceae archaeon]
MVKKKNDDDNEGTINQLFEKETAIPLEAQLWGKNPKRTQLLRDVWFDPIVEQLNEEKDMPEDAKRELMFLMTANSVLDIVMESLPDELALEMSYCMDHMIGVYAVNQRYGIDLLEANYAVVSKIKRDDYDSDEEFEKAVADKEEKWWTVGKQQLSGRSPNDAIAEALSRYGLNK